MLKIKLAQLNAGLKLVLWNKENEKSMFQGTMPNSALKANGIVKSGIVKEYYILVLKRRKGFLNWFEQLYLQRND